MQEHMGKKRKKELREALNLKQDRDKALIKCVAIIGGVIVFSCIYYAIAALRIFPLLTFDNLMLSFVPLALVVVALMFGGPQVPKAQMFNEQFKKYCQDHQVSAEDLDSFKNM